MVRYGEAGEADFPLVGELVIGRTPDCQIWFDEPEVSRRHARLFLVDDAAYVEDFASANGVLRNGHRIVSSAELRPGDMLVIGGHKLLVTWSGDGPAPPPREQIDTTRSLVAEDFELLEKQQPQEEEPVDLAAPAPLEPSGEPDFPEQPEKATAKKGCFALVAGLAVFLCLLIIAVT